MLKWYGLLVYTSGDLMFNYGLDPSPGFEILDVAPVFVALVFYEFDVWLCLNVLPVCCLNARKNDFINLSVDIRNLACDQWNWLELLM